MSDTNNLVTDPEVLKNIQEVFGTTVLPEVKKEPVIHIRHFKELKFTVIAAVNDYFVDFKVYEIGGYEEGAVKGVFDSAIYNKANSDSFDPVSTIEVSEVYLSGSVKWDGCSNWEFDEQERCMLHGCSRVDLVNLGEIMAQCWDMTKELCPKWLD